MAHLLPPPNWIMHSQSEMRFFSGLDMAGFYGKVEFDDIEYYPENRRTERQITQMKRRDGSRKPSNDELINELIDDPELDIERLARNIIENGLRVPVVLSAQKELLDGNRRYLAHCWIKRNGTTVQKDKIRQIDAWVLAKENSDQRSKTRVIAEYNFLDDFKKEWGDYVKARFLYEEHESGRTIRELVELYSGPGFTRNKLTEFINTYRTILQYGQYLDDDERAQADGAEHFVWFQQLFRSYRKPLREDEDFQNAVFKNIKDGNISRTDDLKRLVDMQRYRDAWNLFKKGDVDEAQHRIKGYLLDEKKRVEPDKLMSQVNAHLERLISDEMIEQIAPESLGEFHDLSIQIPGKVNDPNRRVQYLVEQMRTLTSMELRALAEDNLIALETEVQSIARQARATTTK